MDNNTPQGRAQDNLVHGFFLAQALASFALSAIAYGRFCRAEFIRPRAMGSCAVPAPANPGAIGDTRVFPVKMSVLMTQ